LYFIRNQNSYHIVKYLKGNGYLTAESVGNNQWKHNNNTLFKISSQYYLYDGKKYPLCWVNDLVFYIQWDEDYWYYIRNGDSMHTIKYLSGTGYLNMESVGNNKWKKSDGYYFELSDGYYLEDGSKYKLNMLNQTDFYILWGDNYWYFIRNGDSFHSIKYIKGSGYITAESLGSNKWKHNNESIFEIIG